MACPAHCFQIRRWLRTKTLVALLVMTEPGGRSDWKIKILRKKSISVSIGALRPRHSW
jgi:hypothetical protein